jgi:hypothetical protein
MSDDKSLSIPSGHPSPFEAIRRTNVAGNEFRSSRDFARGLRYSESTNIETVRRREDAVSRGRAEARHRRNEKETTPCLA